MDRFFSASYEDFKIEASRDGSTLLVRLDGQLGDTNISGSGGVDLVYMLVDFAEAGRRQALRYKEVQCHAAGLTQIDEGGVNCIKALMSLGEKRAFIALPTALATRKMIAACFEPPDPGLRKV